VSAESGIPTFRGLGGLWRNYRIEEVASPEAWNRDPQLVWEFYSMRRRVASAAKPNPAHFALAKLEDALQDRLFVCTQNVDNLHEQAGSRNVPTCTESFSRAVATLAIALHLTTRISTSRQPNFPAVNAAVGFARTSAGLGKCRSNWIESIEH
jgi:NAD-dependent SIR2 family protein deacetylase